jgi:acyl-CoA thioesterase-2
VTDVGAVADLVALLDLEDLDTDLFRGGQPDSSRARVYGGQVAAQALIAGLRTVPGDYTVHSLHSYFLLPGDYAVPTIFDVERIRDGRSFLTRRVVARQHGRAIYYATISFHVHEDGWDHQDAMPDVPPPGGGMDLLELMRSSGNKESDDLGKEWAGLEIDWIGATGFKLPDDPRHPSQTRMWMRLRSALPAEPTVHQAMFTYMSDISLLGASLAAHGVTPAKAQMASLDHTIWFHRPFRADQWWLYDQWSPSAHGGRGLSLGRVFTEDGTLVATVAQEGLIRPRKDTRPTS